MKVNTFYVIKIVCFTLILVALAWCANGVLELQAETSLRGSLGFMTTALGVCFFSLGLIEYFKGSRYIKKHKIPIEKFEIHPYENVTVIVYKNNAYTIPKHHLHLLDREWVPATEYFDRKKENLGYSIDLPYLRKVA